MKIKTGRSQKRNIGEIYNFIFILKTATNRQKEQNNT